MTGPAPRAARGAGRASPRVRSGNDDFFALSADLVDSAYWPATGARTSWGDAPLHECAHRQRPKAGGGTQWRAWATSHHLAVVPPTSPTSDTLEVHRRWEGAPMGHEELSKKKIEKRRVRGLDGQ